MWVFDGEEWTDEGGSGGANKTPDRPRFDEFTPELQVLEIVPVPRTILNDVPYPQLPMP